jgi:hypothetical protein
VPGLAPDAAYHLGWLGPVHPGSVPSAARRAGPTGGEPVTGHQLAEVGIWMPRRPAETAQLIEVTRA